MAVYAILNPSGLVGNELRERLGRHSELWDELRLLTTDEDDVGTLTDIGGAAAMHEEYEASKVADVDVLFCCGPFEEASASIAALPEGAVAIVLSADLSRRDEVGDATPVVAGVNDAAINGERLLLSPHPAVVLLSHLLRPLLELDLVQASATVIEPISSLGESALDELFDQVRSMLNFQTPKPAAHFDRQVAFNVFPTNGDSGALLDQTRDVLSRQFSSGLELSLQMLRAGVFHSYAASLHVRFEEDPGEERLRSALRDSPALASSEERPPSPVEAANEADVLLGRIEPDGEGGYWLWGVMDNLVRGGAVNAVAIAESLGRESVN